MSLLTVVDAFGSLVLRQKGHTIHSNDLNIAFSPESLNRITTQIMRLSIDTREDRRTYTNGDVIEGHVRLAFNNDTPIDNFTIALFGRASIRLKDGKVGFNPQRYVLGDQTFLKMWEVIKPQSLPENGLARRKQAYGIPFSFKVPTALLSYACDCGGGEKAVASEDHLCLPPSLRSKNVRLKYTIGAKFRRRLSDDTSRVIRMEKEVSILPSIDKICLDGNRVGDSVANATTFKDDGLSTCQDALQAQIPETLSLKLPSPFAGASGDPVLLVPVHLHYQSCSLGSPPALVESVTVTLLSVTSWGISSERKSLATSQHNFARREKTDKTKLGKINLKGLVWTANTSRRTEDGRGPPTLSTTFQIPLRLSNVTSARKVQLVTPSFNSCSISHRHSIELDFSYRAVTKRFALAGPLQGCLPLPSHLKVAASTRLYLQRDSSACESVEARYNASDGLEVELLGQSEIETALEGPPAYTPPLRS